MYLDSNLLVSKTKNNTKQNKTKIPLENIEVVYVLSINCQGNQISSHG